MRLLTLHLLPDIVNGGKWRSLELRECHFNPFEICAVYCEWHRDLNRVVTMVDCTGGGRYTVSESVEEVGKLLVLTR